MVVTVNIPLKNSRLCQRNVSTWQLFVPSPAYTEAKCHKLLKVSFHNYWFLYFFFMLFTSYFILPPSSVCFPLFFFSLTILLDAPCHILLLLLFSPLRLLASRPWEPTFLKFIKWKIKHHNLSVEMGNDVHVVILEKYSYSNGQIWTSYSVIILLSSGFCYTPIYTDTLTHIVLNDQRVCTLRSHPQVIVVWSQFGHLSQAR